METYKDSNLGTGFTVHNLEIGSVREPGQIGSEHPTSQRQADVSVHQTSLRKQTGQASPIIEVTTLDMVSHPRPFQIEMCRVVHQTEFKGATEFMEVVAMVRLLIGDTKLLVVGEGNGPVHAMVSAIQRGLKDHFPQLDRWNPITFQCRVLDPDAGSNAILEVVVEASDGHTRWRASDRSPNFIKAAERAVVACIQFGILQTSGDVSAVGVGKTELGT